MLTHAAHRVVLIRGVLHALTGDGLVPWFHGGKGLIRYIQERQRDDPDWLPDVQLERKGILT
jgi:hypothetical protein